MKNVITVLLALLIGILEISPLPTLAATGNEDCEDQQCDKRVEVTSKIGLPSVPGTIVCRDYDTVSLMIRLYNNAFKEKLNASAYGEKRYRLIYGTPHSPPKLAKFGCILVPPGTRMEWDGNTFPVFVTGKLHNGKKFKGVTSGSMITSGE